MTTLIAEILSEGLSSVQIKIFANFITAIGGMMAYIALQKDLKVESGSKCLGNKNKGINTCLTEKEETN